MDAETTDKIAAETAKLMKVGIVAGVEQNGGALFEYRVELRGEPIRTDEIPIFDKTLNESNVSVVAAILAKVFRFKLWRTIRLRNEHGKPLTPYSMDDVKTPTG